MNVDALIKYLFAWLPFAGLGLAIFAYIMWATSLFKEDPETRAKTAIWLKKDRTRTWYGLILTRALNWLDHHLCPDEIDLPKRHPARAWSLRLLTLNIAFALTYPITFLILNWVIWNDGTIAGLTVIPPDVPWRRWATGAPVSC